MIQSTNKDNKEESVFIFLCNKHSKFEIVFYFLSANQFLS